MPLPTASAPVSPKCKAGVTRAWLAHRLQPQRRIAQDRALPDAAERHALAPKPLGQRLFVVTSGGVELSRQGRDWTVK